jgi:hypothetical protein
MTCCGHCRDAGDFFNERTARRELKRYLRRGPDKPTRLLVEQIQQNSISGKTLLDIGGGIGAIQLELFSNGLKRSVNVDASAAYQSVSKAAAVSRRVADRTEYHYGDFTDLAESLPQAGIVTLDKVVCCYPDAEKLLRTSLQKCTGLLGLVYPRVNAFTKTGFGMVNLWFRVRRSEFRTYLHSPQFVDAMIREDGFRQLSRQTTILWQIVVYERP